MTNISTLKRLDADVLMSSIRALPPLPEVVFKLVKSLEDPRSNIGELEKQIEMDQALSTKLLRVANSSFYGLTRQVGTVRDAAVVLGFAALRSMAIAASTISHFAGQQLPPSFDYRQFWSHGMATGIASELVARECGEAEGVAFTAGLIHDIGRLALACQFPGHMQACYEYKDFSQSTLLHAESEVLGMTHAQIGATLGRHWHFPVAVVDAIENHHQPVQACTDIPHVVLIGEALATNYGVSCSEGSALDLQTVDNSLLHLSLSTAEITNLQSKLADRMGTIDEILSVS